MKNLKNTKLYFGWVAIAFHWITALGLIGLYFSGIIMVDLDYYNPWYNKGLSLHKSIGMLIALLIVLRLLWTWWSIRPKLIENRKWLHLGAKLVHWALYSVSLLLIVSGYLIATSKGQGIDLFDIFTVPATLSVDVAQSEFLGQSHDILASIFMLIAGVHALAALIHHYIFKDNTLKRMLWVQNQQHNLGEKHEN